MAWADQLDFIRCYFPNQGGYISFSVTFKPNSAKKWSTTALTYGLFLFGLFKHQSLNQIFSCLNGCRPNDSVVYLGCSPNGSSPNAIGSPIGCSLFGGEKDRKKANAGIRGRREAQKSGKEFLSSHQRLGVHWPRRSRIFAERS